MAATAAACTPDTPTARLVHEHFGQSGAQAIDLDTAVPAPWQRVCIVGPYMDNEQTRATLGFAWDSGQVSDIASNDGKVLLVFVGDANQVAFHLSYPRAYGDFSNLAGQCFARANAVFEHVAKPAHGWPGLFPKAAPQ